MKFSKFVYKNTVGIIAIVLTSMTLLMILASIYFETQGMYFLELGNKGTDKEILSKYVAFSTLVVFIGSVIMSALQPIRLKYIRSCQWEHGREFWLDVLVIPVFSFIATFTAFSIISLAVMSVGGIVLELYMNLITNLGF